MPVITVRSLSKHYRLGATVRHDTLRDLLMYRFGNFFKSRAPEDSGENKGFWALKDVSFEVEEGEVLGIIGKNGAGKSTLLKILSRITRPTRGEARIKGRIGSLLEVGTGFHPELTGRENIFLSGAILGMKKEEIRRNFDEIVDFAEIEKFLDTPVKRYSSGMYVRLGFAVAAHLEPEILLVDEVLAVGDAQFQKKCLGKMGDISRVGRTILFISHNMIAVQNLCNRCIFLSDGKIEDTGDSQSVISKYLELSFAGENLTEQAWSLRNSPGNEHFQLLNLKISPEKENDSEIITTTDSINITLEYQKSCDDIPCHITMQFFNHQDILVFSTCSLEDGKPAESNGKFRSKCQIPSELLNSGSYRIKLLLVINGSQVICRLDKALVFDVFENNERKNSWFGKRSGLLAPRLNWVTTEIKH